MGGLSHLSVGGQVLMLLPNEEAEMHLLKGTWEGVENLHKITTDLVLNWCVVGIFPRN